MVDAFSWALTCDKNLHTSCSLHRSFSSSEVFPFRSLDQPTAPLTLLVIAVILFSWLLCCYLASIALGPHQYHKYQPRFVVDFPTIVSGLQRKATTEVFVKKLVPLTLANSWQAWWTKCPLGCPMTYISLWAKCDTAVAHHLLHIPQAGRHYRGLPASCRSGASSVQYTNFP